MPVLPDFSNPLIAGFFATYLALIGLAALLGDKPERWAALIFLMIPVSQSALYSFSDKQSFVRVDYGLLAIDMAAVAVLALIAYNANRFWPARAVGALILSATSHVARAAIPGFQELSYLQFNVLPTLAALIVVAIGAAAYRTQCYRGRRGAPWVDYKKQAEIRRILGT